MNTRDLIDGIVQQTTVLIAQISTASGIRAPLAHVADQVFMELAREIEAQGVGRKIVADMFGLALRSYQKKMRRLSEGATVTDRSLWAAVLEVLREEGRLSRQQILARFRRDSEEDVGAVLNDLVGSGFAYCTGRGNSAVFGSTDEKDRSVLFEQESFDSLTHLVWMAVYRSRCIPVEQLHAKPSNALPRLSRPGQRRPQRPFLPRERGGRRERVNDSVMTMRGAGFRVARQPLRTRSARTAQREADSTAMLPAPWP
jgi:hypothetical protein